MLFWRRSCVLTENGNWGGFYKILKLGSGGVPKTQDAKIYVISNRLAFGSCENTLHAAPIFYSSTPTEGADFEYLTVFWGAAGVTENFSGKNDPI